MLGIFCFDRMNYFNSVLFLSGKYMHRLFKKLGLSHFTYTFSTLQVNGGNRADSIYSNYFYIQTKEYYCTFTDGNILDS